MFPRYVSFILSLSRSVSLLERVSGVGGEGPPHRGHCFPVFGRSWRFVTAACASGADATPLPSGRGEGWEGLSGPIGGGGGRGHLEESAKAPGRSHSTVNEATFRPLRGWKHCASWEASFAWRVWEWDVPPSALFEPKVERGDVCVCLCEGLCVCVCVTLTVTHMFYMVVEVWYELWWKDWDAWKVTSVLTVLSVTHVHTHRHTHMHAHVHTHTHTH